MAPPSQKVFRNFDGGVNTAMAPDNLPSNVSPWGRNAVLTAVSGQNALPSRRAGFRVLNQTAITNDPEVTKLVGFNWMDPDSGALTPYLFVVTGNEVGHSQLHWIDPVDGNAFLQQRDRHGGRALLSCR